MRRFFQPGLVTSILVGLLGCTAEEQSVSDSMDSASSIDAAARDASTLDALAFIDAAIGQDSGISPDSGAMVSPVTNELVLKTNDNLSIHAAVTSLPDITGKLPGIILLHQYQQDSTQWGDWTQELAELGYRVLAIDLRGHGRSDAYGGGQLSNILNDPNGAPRDVDAAIEYLDNDDKTQSDRIAIIGTSIGANLAVAASIKSQAKLYVAVSPRIPPTENLAGQMARGMSGVYYLAGELDRGGQAQDCQVLHSGTTTPKKITIFPQTDSHGINLLRKESSAKRSIEDWLKANL